MKAPRIAQWPPFLTIWTATYLRPQALARNLASVGRQTEVDRVEQVVWPDHVGQGFGAGLYERLVRTEASVHGDYVSVLNDDDALVSETAVAQLRKFVERRGCPSLVLVRVKKGDVEFPRGTVTGPPVEGQVDLGSYILRADVWRQFLPTYGRRYQGDYDHAAALYAAGIEPAFLDLLWAEGPQGGGRPEMSL